MEVRKDLFGQPVKNYFSFGWKKVCCPLATHINHIALHFIPNYPLLLLYILKNWQCQFYQIGELSAGDGRGGGSQQSGTGGGQGGRGVAQG